LRALLVLLLLLPLPALALSPAGEEFLRIAKQLEPVQCKKRQLRRQIVLADAERRNADGQKLREEFSRLDRDPKVAKLEKRLAELERHVVKDDLPDINRQHVEAFYRCE
jgi:hypothetical protein